MQARTIFVAVAALLLAAGAVQAGITIETVTVGDRGNAADTRYATPGFGAVSYTYTIGKYEVTAGQYTAFLTALGGVDTYGLYNTEMSNTSGGSGITRGGGGTGGDPYTYSVASAFTNRPVTYVSWGDAARFANWLHNGQPTGAQTAGTTERGAYTLDGATTNAELLAVSRKVGGAGWALSNEDEWYKAAYYKGGSTNAGYWDYPTGSDTAPGRDMADASGNNANYPGSGAYPIDSGKYTTVVGEFQNSDSPYGTFDQGGNAWEWTEAIRFGSWRGLRGGSFYDTSPDGPLRASFNIGHDDPATSGAPHGFRVVAVPERLPGDANYDGQVNVQDLAILAFNYNWYGTWEMGDFTGDGRVTVQDLAILAFNYGRSTPPPAVDVPEPATLSLLALGGSWVLRRRRK